MMDNVLALLFCNETRWYIGLAGDSCGLWTSPGEPLQIQPRLDPESGGRTQLATRVVSRCVAERKLTPQKPLAVCDSLINHH